MDKPKHSITREAQRKKNREQYPELYAVLLELQEHFGDDCRVVQLTPTDKNDEQENIE